MLNVLGIQITGSNHRLERNMVTAALYRGSYNGRFEATNFKVGEEWFLLSNNVFYFNGIL